jgi:hypothetical protein
LAWLEKAIAESAEPVVLIGHEPIAGFAPGLEPSQEEIVGAVKRGNAAARDAGHAGVVLLLCGHLHVDVLSQTELGPSLCVNSASYHWANAMVPYAAALHTVLTLAAEGELAVEACEGEWAPGAEVSRIRGSGGSGAADRGPIARGAADPAGLATPSAVRTHRPRRIG